MAKNEPSKISAMLRKSKHNKLMNLQIGGRNFGSGCKYRGCEDLKNILVQDGYWVLGTRY